MNFWNDPVNFIGQWLGGLLSGLGLAPSLVNFLLSLLGVLVLAMGSLLFTIFLIWYERKILGRIQDRLGPNRVGPFGLIQPIADMMKIFTKEYITPIGADWLPYNLAPIMAVASVLLLYAVIPFGNRMVGVDLNVGVLYLVAIGGFGILAIVMAGWSSNNKYALLGAFRVIALLVSYEVPMVLALLVPVLLSGSMGMSAIVQAQAGGFWYLFVAPLAALVFFLSSIAEVGRAPFDLIEAESEIVAGFNIEYSGLKFGFFYVAEFLHSFTVSVIFATVFLGGWQGPGAATYPLLGFVYFIVKAWIVYFVLLLFRGSLPRFRIDQMMDLNWKVLTPLSLSLVVVIALVDKLLANVSLLVRGIGLLSSSLVVGFVAVEIMRQAGAKRRREVAPAFEHREAASGSAPVQPGSGGGL
ncbi:MAG: NADH-quinone oxidoreductase subunit NuoH [Chloroflexi bacterium]|nr:NADH-quinone oxidoreductase subunit NuoH [Chloroflexota bacterium]